MNAARKMILGTGLLLAVGGLSSVAAPITDRSSRVTAALSVCAHAGRVDPATLRTDFLPLVIETARRVSALVSRH